MSDEVDNVLKYSYHHFVPRIEISEPAEERSFGGLNGNSVKNSERKLSLPVEASSSIAIKTEPRRNSDVGKFLSYYGEHMGHNNTQNRNKKGRTVQQPSFDMEKGDIFIPEVYLEAAKSPGSLREELKQLQTIDEKWKSYDDIADPFRYIDGFTMNKT